MAVKIYKPTTNGRRNMSVLNYKKDITTDKPEKSLLVSKSKTKLGLLLNVIIPNVSEEFLEAVKS